MSQHSDRIAPHGGILVNRIATLDQRQEFFDKAESLPRVQLSDRSISDLQMIAIGALSPLKGFMNEADYLSVVKQMRLSNGLPWSVPITLSVTEAVADTLEEGTLVRLDTPAGEFAGILELAEKYRYSKEEEALNVYRTDDLKHPGVQVIDKSGPVNLAGEVWLLERELDVRFPQYQIDPAKSRILFKEKGWKTIVGFQTRNPIHRAHEYIQKCALETVDGLFLHPLVGTTKDDDIPADVRMRCYEILLEKYYPKERVILAINPAAMRYAGPREAIFHALIRKNYGCTHLVVGRDHAGVGDYYGTYDAQKIFEEFDPGELEITPLMFEHSFFCLTCEGMASSKTCPHDDSVRVVLSGTKVREMLRKGEKPPPEFSRPEVAEILIAAMRGKG